MVLQSPMKVQVLVSALDKDIITLPSQMNIETDAVIVNQCDRYDYYELEKIRCFCMKERGVGLSRNTALLHADADICLFSDEDIVLTKGYAELIKTA